MPKTGHINATWAPQARDALERFLLQHANAPGAVLSLFKSDDGPSGARWSYSVYARELIVPLRAAMEARGHPLLYALDGLTVAVSNVNDLRELDGKVLDLDGPGYLFIRPSDD